jgi:3-oxoacyl-[acyl-carrier-protein] synthase II
MIVTGVGVVSPAGTGLEALKNVLQANTPPLPMPMGTREKLPVLQVPAEVFKNPLLSPVRRADRFSKMSLLAALEAWQGTQADPARVGIILASACGPHATVFKFVNDLLEFGESQSSPTVFSQSVHAAAASMIASAIKSHGPVLNVADLRFPFETALELADAWLKEGRCDVVLVGATEECSEVYIHAISRMWGDRFVPGEGSFFFRCEREGKGPSVRVQKALVDLPARSLKNSLSLGEGSSVEAQEASGIRYSGSLRIGGAFLLAVADWLLRGEQFKLLGEAVSSGPIQIISKCGDSQRVIVVEEKQ